MSNRVTAALRACRPAFAGAAAFSFVINALALAVPLFTWQLFDRVLSSHSTDTLIALAGVTIAGLAVAGLLEVVRSRTFVHVSAWIDATLGGVVLAQGVQSAMQRGTGTSTQGLRDLGTVRGFLTGTGLLHLFDAPWVPIFIGAVWLLHPSLGTIATVGGILLFCLVLLNEFATRRILEQANALNAKAMTQVDSTIRSAEAVEAMGMLPAVLNLWNRQSRTVTALQNRASNRAGLIQAAAKSLRMILQVTILGTGAYLVINAELSAGAMIASSIILARALAPVEHMVGTWRGFVSARGAYRRLRRQDDRTPLDRGAFHLPAPAGHLVADGVTLLMPGRERPVLHRVSFSLEPGDRLAVIGPSAAGKSSLMRLCMGVWRPDGGRVRLDGADISHWNREELGCHIGYLPQAVELFEGSVRSNIARMAEADDAAILAAARLAGAHETILQLPQGYDTPVASGAANLSGGQRQLIGLARALFGQPRLLVLDEPNANLDAAGDAALRRALEAVKRLGITTIVVTHVPSLLAHTDKVLSLRNGQVRVFGPTQQVLAAQNASSTQAGTRFEAPRRPIAARPIPAEIRP
ncbi:MAG: type I secretion system permease/ATPase [Alphaproteobacteria bacterium]